MDATPNPRGYQFSLRTLLVAAMLGPPIIAGCMFLLRVLGVSAPYFLIVLSAAQIAFWLFILVCVVRGALLRKEPRAAE